MKLLNSGQISRLLRVIIVATLIMLCFEIIFSISIINNFFSNLIKNSSGFLVYLILWVIMFAQVTILNIPAYSILSVSLSIGIDVLGWKFLTTVISAYMVGCILAYWIGRVFGVKAVKWCAGNEDDFNKWVGFINTKGKWWYFLTILFPIFPDDLLCIVAGSVKFNFLSYCLFNLFGRSIGLVSMLLTLKLIGFVSGGFPFMIIVWAVALIGELIALKFVKNN